jgi:hypothetical protein
MTIQRHELENKYFLDKDVIDIPKVIKQIKSKKDLVRFALYCAKDCFHLNTEEQLPLSQYCISSMEQWLVGTAELKSGIEKNKKLLSIVRSFYISNAIDAAVNVARTALYDYDDLFASCAAQNAIDLLDESQKQTEYLLYAFSLLRTSNIDKSKLEIRGVIDGKSTLMALFDNLNELNEDILIRTNNDGILLNCPVYVASNEMDELIDKVWSNKIILHYLEKLYGR